MDRGSPGHGRSKYGRSGTSKSGRGSSSSNRDTLLAAVALQDHIARTMRIPGGPKTLPSMEPGSQLTLAQNLGLVPRPPPLLTEAMWDEVHLKARLRQDSDQECPICRELFKSDPQVLLSCTHIFHKACLASYERFARARACPLCRSQQYQRRVITDAAEAFRVTCATRIQAATRGWLARRRYRALRRHHPPSNPRLRRQWAAERLEEESDKLLGEINEDRGDLEALFAELDANLAQSRKVCDEMARPMARRLRQQLEQAEQQQQQQQAGASRRVEEEVEEGGSVPAAHGRRAPLLDVDLYGGMSGRLVDNPHRHAPASSPAPALLGSAPPAAAAAAALAGSAPPPAAAAAALPGSAPPLASSWAAQPVDWTKVVAQAKARGEGECPICIGPLGRRGNMGVAWLSCTHCFHLDCIMAFEAFELSHGGTPSCPVCRSGYQRRCFE